MKSNNIAKHTLNVLKTVEYLLELPYIRYKLGTLLLTPLRLISFNWGPFKPKSTLGNSYIMIVTDYFTKWIEAIPLPDKKSPNDN